MTEEIQVNDIIEVNNCAGRKFITVTHQASDELVASHYRLAAGWMPPEQKLALTTVDIGDTVKVIRYPWEINEAMGEFVHVNTLPITKYPLCLCHHLLVSDGYDVYCPNPDCALTVATRLNRLGHTFFFDPKFLQADLESYFPGAEERTVLSFPENTNQSKPFYPITKGMFWGSQQQSLQKILLNIKNPVSLATFMVEPLFEEFLENCGYGFPGAMGSTAFNGMYRFFGMMREACQRREYDNDYQNTLLYEFLWALGIESLNTQIIHQLIQYEIMSGSQTSYVSPMVFYAYALTHPNELVRETDTHALEAYAILGEIRQRRHEFFDIFYHFSEHDNDIRIMFDQLG